MTLKTLVLVAATLLAASFPALSVEVDVRGELDGAARENIATAAAIGRLQELDTPASGTIRRLLRQLPGQVRTALEPFGYYQAEIESRLEGEGEQQRVVVDVNPGDPVRIEQIDITWVTPDSQPPAIDQSFALQEGARLDHAQYESAKRAIQARLLDAGYLDARLETHRVAVRRADNAAVVSLKWNTGPRYRFGSVEFADAPLDEPFLRRYVPFEVGEYYSQSEVLALNVALLNSGYFESVSVGQGDPVGEVVPIRVQVVPRPRDLYEIGVSYGTDSGPGFDLGFERRYVNRRGHSANAELGLSARRQRLEANYIMPRRRSAEAHYALGLALVDEETDSNERRNARLSASRFGLWRGWRRTDALTLLREDFEIGTQDDSTTLLIPSVSLTKAKAKGDDLIPTAGQSWRASVSGGVESLLSDTSFIQVGVAHKRIWPVGAHRLLARAEVGATWVDDFRKLPPSLRYFAGGDRSLRGFDYEALGPLDAEDNVIGGEYLVLGSVEYEHHVRGPWRVAAFLDAGNAFSDGDRDLEYGIGFGLRYATPVGLIRVDLAAGISEPGNPIRLHLVVGPDL